MKLASIMATAALLLACSGAVARESRLERDFRTQKLQLNYTESDTGDEACRYPGSMRVYRAGREVRKIEFSIGCSNRDVERDFYFSRGKAVLAIQREYWILDENAEPLQTRRPPVVKRVWLTELGGNRAQRELRKELQAHADELLKKASL